MRGSETRKLRALFTLCHRVYANLGPSVQILNIIESHFPLSSSFIKTLTESRVDRGIDGTENNLARIFHELLSRDHEDGRATWQPQVGFEAYLNGTSQVPTPEDARKDGHIRGRSKSFMKYPG